ncbi:hypothetical protein [Microcoleus sp. PH2017_02_FOX_O_A]|uniref:hypothetical protein n=1 Tax=Microcoleus sp. PH2017_02_FOX_O_A TaxID=2798813 RepID=UPI0025CCD6DE|nr:hypothetical protein [Microcoleus sp. PH2017_02_FOX_O_A]
MISDNSNQPKEYDAVLGGQSQIPIAAAVLGGIAGVKQRLHSPSVEPRMAAVSKCSELLIQFCDNGQNLLSAKL